mmetsp:Transcript_115388/g.257830  ORF Transcript_115388/g.257830 Transcript_115388/m.257830 type:complete len:96 (-) Transcript_115388:18-305(-)
MALTSCALLILAQAYTASGIRPGRFFAEATSMVEEGSSSMTTGRCCKCGNGAYKYRAQGSCSRVCGSSFVFWSSSRDACAPPPVEIPATEEPESM